MALSPYVIEEFRGPYTPGERGSGDPTRAMFTPTRDVVYLPGNAAVRSRKGFDNYVTAAAEDYIELHPHDHTYLLARHGTSLVDIEAGVGENAGGLTITNAYTSFATMGLYTDAGAATYTYVAHGVSGQPIAQFTAGTWTAGTTLATVDGSGSEEMPGAIHVAVDPDSNRLVAANTPAGYGPGAGSVGAQSDASTIWFSDPGAPKTWSTNNYIHLQPGDGEAIVAMVVWRGQIFVFKPSTLFIFYGESIDSEGNPIFNYRTVKLPADAKCLSYISNCGNGTATVGPAGVYYLSAGAVWMTTGDVPFRVTDNSVPDAVLGATPYGDWDDPTGLFYGTSGIHYHMGKLFVTVDANENAPRNFVVDAETGDLAEWNSYQRGFTTWTPGSQFGLPNLFSAAGGTTHASVVNRWDSFGTVFDNDDGDTITATWQSQFSDFGYPGTKRVREVEVWGTGGVNVSLLSDYYTSSAQGAASTGADLTLSAQGGANELHGRSPTYARYRVSQQGKMFSVKLTNDASNNDWEVSRIVIHFAEPKNIGPTEPSRA